MPPIAIARLAHHLPSLAVEGQRFRAGDATLGIKADGMRRQRCRRRFAVKQFLGRRHRIVRVCQRGQRLGIDAAQVLRRRKICRSSEGASRSVMRHARPLIRAFRRVISISECELCDEITA
jgi:hypothetical protein